MIWVFLLATNKRLLVGHCSSKSSKNFPIEDVCVIPTFTSGGNKECLWYDFGMSIKSRCFDECGLNGRIYVATDSHLAHKKSRFDLRTIKEFNFELILFGFIVVSQTVIGTTPEEKDAKIDTTDEKFIT